MTPLPNPPQITNADMIQFLQDSVTREQTKLILAKEIEKPRYLKSYYAARALLKMVKEATNSNAQKLI